MPHPEAPLTPPQDLPKAAYGELLEILHSYAHPEGMIDPMFMDDGKGHIPEDPSVAASRQEMMKAALAAQFLLKLDNKGGVEKLTSFLKRFDKYLEREANALRDGRRQPSPLILKLNERIALHYLRPKDYHYDHDNITRRTWLITAATTLIGGFTASYYCGKSTREKMESLVSEKEAIKKSHGAPEDKEERNLQVDRVQAEINKLTMIRDIASYLIAVVTTLPTMMGYMHMNYAPSVEEKQKNREFMKDFLLNMGDTLLEAERDLARQGKSSPHKG